MAEKYLLALDQGTTSSRAVLFDLAGHPVGQRSRETHSFYPQAGWVEQDPEEIWESQLAVAQEVLAQTGVSPRDVIGIGLTNQRETTILWERDTGRPVYKAIVWQCRRTAELCDELKARGWQDEIRARTGLVLDAYFSGPKVKWILDHVPGLRTRAQRGEILFGTVDTWLIWKLTGGTVHATDFSNASRTLLFNLHTLTWDREILELLDIPLAVLPEIRPSAGRFGETVADLFGRPLPILGVAGDQQAALFGQSCFAPGLAKNTYGTGCFLLAHTGRRPVFSREGLLTTVAWGLPDGVEFALEGSVFIAGAVIQWLRDGLGLLQSAGESEKMARSVPDTGGVYFVPAFTGLGAPYWDMYARGTVVGLTRGTTRAHLVRAALEAIAYQTKDVLLAMERDSGYRLSALRVDGGASTNDFLMQFQSDILGVPVERSRVAETTALGAALLAGLAGGVWPGREAIAALWSKERTFEPEMAPAEAERLYAGWRRAVQRARNWAVPEGEGQVDNIPK